MLYKVKAQITSYPSGDKYEQTLVIKEDDIEYIQQKDMMGTDFYTIFLKEHIELYTEWDNDKKMNRSRTLKEIDIKSLDDIEVLKWAILEMRKND